MAGFIKRLVLGTPFQQQLKQVQRNDEECSRVALSANDNEVTEEQFQQLMSALGTNTHVSTFGAQSSCELLHNASNMAAFASMLQRNRSIETLGFDTGTMKPEQLELLAHAIGQHQQLQHFNLSGVAMAGRGSLALGFDQCLQLRRLYLRRCSGLDVLSLCRLLEAALKLEQLDLALSAFGDVSSASSLFSTLLGAVATHPALTEFDAAGFNMRQADSGSDGLAIAQLLRRNSTLRTLMLNCSHLSTDALEAVADVLQVNSTLQFFTIGAFGDGVSDERRYKVVGVIQAIVQENTSNQQQAAARAARMRAAHNASNIAREPAPSVPAAAAAASASVGSAAAGNTAAAPQAIHTLQKVQTSPAEKVLAAASTDMAKLLHQIRNNDEACWKIDFRTDLSCSAEQFKHLMLALHKNTRVRVLNFQKDVKLLQSFDAMQALVDMLKQNRSIDTLDIRSDVVSVEHIPLLAEGIAGHPRLRVFTMYRCHLTPASSTALLSALKTCPKLKHLYLQNCGQLPVSILIDLLHSCSSLIIFGVHMSDLEPNTHASWKCCSAPSRCTKSFRHVSCRGRSWTTSGCASLPTQSW